LRFVRVDETRRQEILVRAMLQEESRELHPELAGLESRVLQVVLPLHVLVRLVEVLEALHETSASLVKDLPINSRKVVVTVF
jgi:hypothetical protein